MSFLLALVLPRLIEVGVNLRQVSEDLLLEYSQAERWLVYRFDMLVHLL
jgi:hypothetical protein